MSPSVYPEERIALSKMELSCLKCGRTMKWAGDGQCHFECECGEERHFCPFPGYHVRKGHDLMEHIECVLREDGNYHCPVCLSKTTHHVGCPVCGIGVELNGFRITCPKCGPMGELVPCKCPEVR